MTAAPPSPDENVIAALRRMGLVRDAEELRFTALGGGVASDIWKVDCRGDCFCVKRALAKLRVARDWRVTVERSAYEVAWLETVAGILPNAVPRLLGSDAREHLFAMSWMPEDRFRNWKSLLMRGDVRPGVAAAVGAALATIHSGTAGDAAIAARFPTDAIFRDIRLDAYLGAAADMHHANRARLHELIDRTATTKLALVHGDVSPKNVLVADTGPVFLDAECAWYGDPAFDLAFCLNHLLLKCLWRRQSARDYAAAFAELAASYLAGVTWEAAGSIEARAAHLLPGLLLARIDGKSPVEYVTGEEDKRIARDFSSNFLLRPADSLAALRGHWEEAMTA
ncbi:MAG: phosphotransferase [Pseudomonadota bacterium]|nr:phosphotransferase [Pseudomonadota bacterium]